MRVLETISDTYYYYGYGKYYKHYNGHNGSS
jgi:hypothetical protein